MNYNTKSANLKKVTEIMLLWTQNIINYIFCSNNKDISNQCFSVKLLMCLINMQDNVQEAGNYCKVKKYFKKCKKNKILQNINNYAFFKSLLVELLPFRSLCQVLHEMNVVILKNL